MCVYLSNKNYTHEKINLSCKVVDTMSKKKTTFLLHCYKKFDNLGQFQ